MEFINSSSISIKLFKPRWIFLSIPCSLEVNSIELISKPDKFFLEELIGSDNRLNIFPQSSIFKVSIAKARALKMEASEIIDMLKHMKRNLAFPLVLWNGEILNH